jgi:hypothetical protein
MPSHAVSVTCRRLTCGPKFVSVVFLSIRPIPRTPIPNSSPPSPNPSSAQRSCVRGHVSARQVAGMALLRADAACGRGAPTRADAAYGRGGLQTWRTEAARRGGLHARKLLGSASCRSSPSSVPLLLLRASEPADSPFTSSNPRPDATACKSPNLSSRGGLRRAIPLLPPRIRAPRGGLRQCADAARQAACARGRGWADDLRSAWTRLGGRPAGAAACARGRGWVGGRPAQRADAAQRGGLRTRRPAAAFQRAQSTEPPSQRRQHLQRRAPDLLPNDGSTCSGLPERSTPASFPTTVLLIRFPVDARGPCTPNDGAAALAPLQPGKSAYRYFFL